MYFSEKVHFICVRENGQTGCGVALTTAPER